MQCAHKYFILMRNVRIYRTTIIYYKSRELNFVVLVVNFVIYIHLSINLKNCNFAKRPTEYANQ